MGRRIQKKRRGLFLAPYLSSFYNRPLTRGDTIGHILGDYELGISLKEKKGIPQLLICQSNKPRRVITREKIKNLTEVFQPDGKNLEATKNNMICLRKPSVQNFELEKAMKSKISSYYGLKSLKNQCFQDASISNTDSFVSRPLFHSQEFKNQLAAEAKECNVTCAPDVESRVKSNDSSFQSLSSINSDLYQDALLYKLDSSVPFELIESQDKTSDDRKSKLNVARNISFQNLESQNEKILNNNSFYRVKSFISKIFQDTCNFKPVLFFRKEMVVSQDEGKQIIEYIEEEKCCLWNPESKNVKTMNNAYLHNLNEFEANASTYTDPKEYEKQTVEHAKETEWNEKFKRLEISNSCEDNFSCINDHSAKDSCSFRPHAQVLNQNVLPRKFQSYVSESVKDINLNKWMGNAMDSVAAILLPYVP